MRSIRRLVGVLPVVAVLVGLWAPAAWAEDGGGLTTTIRTAQAEYRADEPLDLTLTVTNGTGAACGLSRTAEGTVQITSVRRDGQELAPALSRSFFLDGIQNAVRLSLARTDPGSTVDVPVRAIRLDDGDTPASVVLRSVAPMPSGTGLDNLWPVGAPGRYEVTLAYSVPLVDGELTPCAGATAARTVTFTVGEGGGIAWWWFVAGGLVALVVLVLVFFLVRRRRPAAAAGVLLMVSVVGVVTGTGRPARADYEVKPNSGIPVPNVDFEKAVGDCLAGFAMPGGDPAGILPRLKDPKSPKVRIVPTTGESGAFETPASKAGPGSSAVTWNPTSTDEYEPGVPRDPCAALYHELNHANDISKGTVPQGKCGETGIDKSEVKATLAENRYRRAKGLPPRTQYKGNKLPENMDECKKPPKKPVKPPKGPIKLCEGTPGGNCGSTNGDPHLVTFDRAYYDFQAVGEFVLARSTAGDPLEIQVRQSPLGTDRSVSVNAAIAFRVGGSRVQLTLHDRVTRVHLDGKETALAEGERKGGLTRRGSDTGSADGYDVTWPDSSAAAVDPLGGYGYRLLVKLAPARAGKVEGLLGNLNGDPNDDIAPAGGKPLAQPVPFETLYPSYADSWRVRPDTSLFTYASGQGTETFTDKAYPERRITVADLNPAQRRQAEEACRWAGVTDSWQFLECVFDVGVSGRPEFAVGSATSEAIAPPVGAPIAATPIATGVLTAGSNDTLTFDGRAGQAVYVDAIGPTLDSACSPWQLVDPSGERIRNGCHINGIGEIDRTELKVDGKYTVRMDNDEWDTGRATVRVYLAADAVSAIEPNGPPVVVDLTQPGSVARLRFRGKAGERVFVDVPETSLPSQCSPLRVVNRDESDYQSGCLISGSGDVEGFLLAADGEYTVELDPADRAVGSAVVHVYLSKDTVEKLAVNGPPVTATIPQPGSVARFEFEAKAGDTVRLAATGATLPNQCSPLRLLDPDGEFIRSGCIINGEGDINEVPLPATGKYTIELDPSESATGVVTLSLHS